MIGSRQQSEVRGIGAFYTIEWEVFQRIIRRAR